MKKILFLPFLQMPTGHHQVADALINSLQKRVQGIYKKVDFLSHVNQQLEKLVTGTYLKWIDFFPHSYNWAYRRFVYPSSSTKHLQLYESLFQTKMHEMLTQEQPDLIVCTQAYPSFLINKLKLQAKLTVPVVNVYTDFFINKVWGNRGIDYHFVPDAKLKQELVDNQGISGNRVFVTGIPVDESFVPTARQRKTHPPYHVLIAGGNNGLGDIAGILKGIHQASELRFSILCGNNQKLFQRIASWGMNNVKPIPYLYSRQAMNDLYDQADAIITKPGGVTISEAFLKKLPIFVHSALPGQEEINRKYLTSRGLAIELKPDYAIRDQLLGFLSDQAKRTRWRKQVELYHQRLETSAWQKILELTVHGEFSGEAQGINLSYPRVNLTY